MKTIAVLLLSLVFVASAFAGIIGQMKGIFVCDTQDTYNQAVDMIRQQNWDAVDRLVLSGRCTQINKGDVIVENVTSLTGLVRVHPRGKTTSWWASAEEIGYPLKAGQLEYDCHYSKMHGMPVTGGRSFRGLKPLWYNGVPP